MTGRRRPENLKRAEIHGQRRVAETVVALMFMAFTLAGCMINDCLVMPAGFPKTRRKLEAPGRDIRELETDEARKMDGGLTCLSIRF